jgi:hypothetical protein
LSTDETVPGGPFSVDKGEPILVCTTLWLGRRYCPQHKNTYKVFPDASGKLETKGIVYATTSLNQAGELDKVLGANVWELFLLVPCLEGLNG